MGFNDFTGNFPVSLHSCKSLRAVRICTNRLEGQIPPEVSQLQFLSFFSIAYNNLTNITGAIKILTRCKFLSVVIIASNFFHETIPTNESIAHFDGFENVQLLGLGGCNLTGQLPTWLSNLKKLEILKLHNNRITGSIPYWFSTLPRLKHLDLSNNHLSGEIPKELCSLPALISAQALENYTSSFLLPLFRSVGSHRLEGQYNSLFSIYPRIWFHNNSLNGKIPIEIGRLKLLHVLDLSDNNFSGNIPGQMSKLTNLEALNLAMNRLSGEIPVSLVSLNFLSHFSVANNNLSGPIPSGTQLQSFSPSAYEGNAGLCGSPLPKKCTHTVKSNEGKKTHDEKVGRHKDSMVSNYSGAWLYNRILGSLWFFGS
ncbi:Tyrosine-sulfated glycopeptide receptor 1 [Morella rubra]|uniref:Tyrosine-sulfated glycopeptide receptor 1 n=1 Tax=Morella rubra TaxID=262757 RepID=A0A6A1WZB1_9ROSI|nr:Tyrosine-sulfated glycopeptide receptor 1 [Morella rubra]